METPVRWLPKAALVVALASSLHSGAAAAQTRSNDPRGQYVITVHNDAGQLVRIGVARADRVRALVSTEISPAEAGAWRYRYTIRVDRHSPQALFEVYSDCPRGAAPSGLASRSGGQDSESSLFAHWELRGDAWKCSFDVSVAIGDSGSGTFTARYLPGIGRVSLVGATDGVIWPTSDPTDETVALQPIVDSLTGFAPNGLAVQLPAPVPLYDPVILAAHPDSAYHALAGSLRDICRTTDWIPSRGTCRALGTELRAVGEALGLEGDDRGHGRDHYRPWAAPPPDHRAGAERHLGQFLDGLKRGRGRRVSETAYGMLTILAHALKVSLAGT